MKLARLGWVSSFCVLCAYSFADREIFIPTGDKLPQGTVRLEYLQYSGGNNYSDAFAAAGITKNIEAEFQLDRVDSEARLGTFSASYTFFNPIVDALPGISVGVQDALDRTERGRSVYLATTFRRSNLGAPGADVSEFNVGVGAGRKILPFAGMVMPLARKVRLLLEHDGIEPTAGLEVRPFGGLGLRFMARQRETFWSVRYSLRF